MTSSVFFKFKSQKEPTRVEFDGTGISVFELKRDIIIKSGLGDGTDFDLAIYTEDGSEEYDDDTTIIPRSTTVIARRLPPMKAGAGRAARYVSGKMPVNAKNSSRREQQIKAAAKSASNAIAQMNSAMTEEEKMNAMFAAQTEQWSAQQEEMSHQTPVFKPGAKKPVNVPDHEPPQGYICYRCGEKGHWIQQCPTNDNPEFDNKPRVKRTTGIPKSFLKTVDKATVLAQNGAEDDSKTPSGIMVNADGDFVIAEPDRAAWEQFQAKTKSSAAAQKVAAQDEKELQDRGLLCPIDKKMFIDPMKTPCCAKTYCNDCITNALIEGDLVCPGCQTEGVLIDDLKSDEEATVKIEAYLKEKTTVKAKEEPKSPAAANSPTEVKSPAPEEVKTTTETESEQVPDHPTKSKSPTPPTSVKSPSETPQKSPPPTSKESTPTVNGEQQNSKKRPAEDVAENPKIPKAPKAMQKAQEAQQTSMMNMMNGMPNMPNMPGMPNMPNMMMPFGGMPNMMNPMMMGMPNMNMNNMNMGMMNPMMMGMPPFNNMNGFQGMNGNAGWGMNGMNGGGMNGNMNAGLANGFNPQRPPNFAGQPVGEDDAYFRKPVNPHRHQNRQRRVRPSDYREL